MHANHRVQRDRDVYDIGQLAMHLVQLRHIPEQLDPGLVPFVYGYRRLYERVDVYALDELTVHHVHGWVVSCKRYSGHMRHVPDVRGGHLQERRVYGHDEYDV